MSRKIAFACLSATLLFTPVLHASDGTLKIRVDQPGAKIADTFYGAFFEDINYSADGGLYAELIQNRSFEYDPRPAFQDLMGTLVNMHADAVLQKMGRMTPLYSWKAGPEVELFASSENPLNANNRRYLEIWNRKDGPLVVFNAGYDGIPAREGKKYNFSVYARRTKELDAPLTISLVTPKGESIGQATIPAVTKEWAQYRAVIESTKTAPDAQLKIETKGGDRLCLDMVSLFPQETFKGRPNGLRPDLAQAIANLNPKFLRFPGGCVVHAPSIASAYRWEDTVGPVETRKNKWNRWGYYQSYGLGYYEFMQFCEDIGAEPLPCLPMGITPDALPGIERIVPMDKMQEWVDSALNLIEFANGPVDSKWGGLRASMGHPAPFGLKYLSIGNEEGLWPEMKERYALFHAAIKAKYPEIRIVGSLGPSYKNEEWYKFMDQAGADLGDEHYYCGPEWYFDNVNRFDNYPKGKTKMFIGEYASHGNTLLNALAEAAYLTGAERNADFVQMTCYAPLLARYNNTQWGVDLIYFDNDRPVFTPNYHMLAMFGNNKGDVYLKGEIQAPGRERLHHSASLENKSGDLIIKLVNGGNEPAELAVSLEGIKAAKGKTLRLAKEGTLTTLSGDAKDSNTQATPEKIKPVVSKLPVGTSFNWKVPAMSVQTLRIAGAKD